MPTDSNETRLSRSREDYLKALYTLAPEGGAVSTSGLAARLEVSAPSVTNMLGRLARERLVAHTPRAGARLTAEGRRRALLLVRRHRLLETFLVDVLGLDWAEAHEDAEVLEHHVSERVIEAMDRLAGRPAEDPHGHVIPDRAGRMRARALAPLASLPAGARATVREIRDRDVDRMARWKRAGVVPGANVHVRRVGPGEDLVEIEVGGRRWLTGPSGLEGVLVEPRGRRRRARSS